MLRFKHIFFTLFLLGGTSFLFHANTKPELTLWATYYYIPAFAHSNTGVSLLNVNGETTGMKLDSCDWCSAAIEGTVIIRKENKDYLYTYAGRSKQLQYDCRLCVKYRAYDNYLKSGQVLWMPGEGYGKGIKNYKLVPYRTIAVDPTVIPLGSVIYISDADGKTVIMENGETWVHDGYFFAGDVGSAVKGNHIDIFTGKLNHKPFDFVGSSSNVTFEARLETNPKVIADLRKIHL